jgi:uncharacterized protein (UPF0332 family)
MVRSEILEKTKLPHKNLQYPDAQATQQRSFSNRANYSYFHSVFSLWTKLIQSKSTSSTCAAFRHLFQASGALSKIRITEEWVTCKH